MKAKLTFNLPEESEEFESAANGSYYKSAIFEFDQKLRSIEKYSEIESMTIESVRDMLRDYLSNYNLKL